MTPAEGYRALVGDDAPSLTYSGSWPEVVTRRELQRELKRHGFTLADYDADNGGPADEYDSAEVLTWLGY